MLKRIPVLILLCLIVFLAIPGTAKADNIDYSIPKYIVESSIREDGSMDVTETITYKFSDSANGIFREIEYTNNVSDKPNANLYTASDIQNISVYEIKGDTKDAVEFKQGQATNGMNGIYSLEKTKYGIKIKIYSPVKNGNKIFIIKYTLSDVIVKHSDTAEVFWKVIGDRWESDLENVRVTVSLPQSGGNSIRVFSHGPLEGNSRIVDDKKVEYTINRINSGTSAEIRVLFPVSLVPNSKKIVSGAGLDKIMDYEAKVAELANQKRYYLRISIGLAIGWFLLSLIIFVALYLKYGRREKPDFEGMYITSAPGDYGPAVATHVISYGYIGAKEITAEIVNMVKKQYLIMEPIETKNNKKVSDYSIKRNISKSIDNALEHEKFLITWFIDKIGNENHVTFEEIKKYSQKNYKEFSADLTLWKGIIKKEAENLGFTSKGTAAVYIGLVFFLVSLAIGITSGIIWGMWAFTVLAAMSSFFVFALSFIFRKLSPQMAGAMAKWSAYRKYLKDVSREKTEDSLSLSLWEEGLMYAIIFGFHSSSVRHIKNRFPEDAYNNTNLTYLHSFNIPSGGSFSPIDSFSSSITSAMSNFSSTTGVGGGSSGGTGGGGGGGGGAF